MKDALKTVLAATRGRISTARRSVLDDAEAAVCERIKEMASTLDFGISSRGWCYILEDEGLSKGLFDKMQARINVWRKSGLLPLDICVEDAARKLIGLPGMHQSLDDEASTILWSVRSWVREYEAYSYWRDRDVCLVMVVEKIDLIGLFQPVCERYHVPLANAKGWSDLNLRAAMMRHLRKHDDGRDLVVLYCADHDPAGLFIADTFRRNMEDLTGAVGWDPSDVQVDRFAMDADFIDANGLSWIDNLTTSGNKDLANPKHTSYGTYRVADYIEKYGRRKCEANSLVVNPKLGRQLCKDAILKWMPDAESELEEHEAAQQDVRNELRDTVREQLAEF